MVLIRREVSGGRHLQCALGCVCSGRSCVDGRLKRLVLGGRIEVRVDDLIERSLILQLFHCCVELCGQIASLLEADRVLLFLERLVEDLQSLHLIDEGLRRLVIDDDRVDLALLERLHSLIAGIKPLD